MLNKIIFLSIVIISSLAFAIEDPLDQMNKRILVLSEVIGFYPPNINSDKEKESTEKEYLSLKKQLDNLIKKSPKDANLLYIRGNLQAMGHNFDYPKAWEGASSDLKSSLSIQPHNEAALLSLATLWVNSQPDLAKQSENLYRAAQCYHGKEPLEEAQSGIFFALYYQGKVPEAFSQASYLKNKWPTNAKYSQIYDMSKSVLQNKGGSKPVTLPPENLVLASCENNESK